MSWWSDDEREKRRKALEKQREKNRKEFKKSWNKLVERAKKDNNAQLKFEDEAGELLADPQAFSNLTDDELDYYKISAEAEINRLERGLGSLSKIEQAGKDEAQRKNKPGLGAFFDAIGGLSSVLVDNRASKFERLRDLIIAEQKRRIKSPLQLSAAQQEAQRVADIMKQVNELESQRDEDIRKNPTGAANINRQYRKLIDDLMNQL